MLTDAQVDGIAVEDDEEERREKAMMVTLMFGVGMVITLAMMYYMLARCKKP